MDRDTQLLGRIERPPTTQRSRAITDESAAIGNMPRPAATPRKFIVRPLVDPETTLDLTDAVIDAIARELGRAFGGNAVLNRLEAGAHLGSLLASAARRSSGERMDSEPRGREHAPQPVPLGLPLHIDGGQHAG